jgi:hypothetical protein
MATADMLADDPGTGLLHCYVVGHMHAGLVVAVHVIE